MLKYNGVKTESEWNREFCKSLVQCNAQVFACVASQMQTPGWPDRYVAHPLFTGWIELKRMRNDLTGLQCNVQMSVNRIRPGTMFTLWLEHDELYPLWISWFSTIYRNNSWPNVDVTYATSALDILKALGSLQRHEELNNK